jgi:hypothetical protein
MVKDMFFSLFWTAYIPVTLILLSLIWQSLVDFFHRKQGRARIACDQAKFMSQRQSRDPRDARPMLVDNWR